ncbi:MAG: hypothetical protein GW928_09360 [Rhodoferax sp.]|nr:hypothetical protein [Betaproteobacteria bacterium]NCN97627.1 hypothetical protein [Rhodoferax sp.]OIP15836.1 MAG: hypothetical protein AUK50_10155 [Comamonadaceae bacterium CG2_30_57_122]PIZ23412.1 MAG: hypothetical protein COY49_03530 [Comamonadaceae bacterium CG_4_10_14_0_8_um_filter_57_29]PJC22809.1 MAG: hypothetical protein CO065_00875 [Comamonadaceae bacterium CG_4_9_14_0_8_um_filter_57_21]
MAALAATNSATPSLQSTLIRSRIESARHQADQAEAQAQDLRAQADAQEQQVQQARQRVQTLEQGANAAASKPAQPLSDRVTTTSTALKNEPTYAGVLASVFQLAKPILTSDLKPTQKNVVTSSLFTATNTAWSIPQNGSQAIARYDQQTAGTFSQTVGRFIDATV